MARTSHESCCTGYNQLVQVTLQYRDRPTRILICRVLNCSCKEKSLMLKNFDDTANKASVKILATVSWLVSVSWRKLEISSV